LSEKNFKLDFEPKIISVEMKPRLVGELLMKAKEILFSKEPPPSKEKCQGTCVYLDKVISHLKVIFKLNERFKKQKKTF
jgi:hypothetical protein